MYLGHLLFYYKHLYDTYFQSVVTLGHHNIFGRSLELLSSQQSMRIVFNTLEGSYALCLLANLIQLAYIERHTTLKDLCFPTFTVSTIIISLTNHNV